MLRRRRTAQLSGGRRGWRDPSGTHRGHHPRGGAGTLVAGVQPADRTRRPGDRTELVLRRPRVRTAYRPRPGPGPVPAAPLPRRDVPARRTARAARRRRRGAARSRRVLQHTGSTAGPVPDENTTGRTARERRSEDGFRSVSMDVTFSAPHTEPFRAPSVRLALRAVGLFPQPVGVDGAGWPRTREPTCELAEPADVLDPSWGRITHVAVGPGPGGGAETGFHPSGRGHCSGRGHARRRPGPPHRFAPACGWRCHRDRFGHPGKCPLRVHHRAKGD